MRTLREKLDRAAATDGRHYLLTVAAPASGWLLRGMESYQALQYLDYVNAMSYDLHGAWNHFVGPNAALPRPTATTPSWPPAACTARTPASAT